MYIVIAMENVRFMMIISHGDDDDDDDDDDRPSPAKTTTTSACCSRLGMTFYHILYLIAPDTSSCVPGCKQVCTESALCNDCREIRVHPHRHRTPQNTLLVYLQRWRTRSDDTNRTQTRG